MHLTITWSDMQNLFATDTLQTVDYIKKIFSDYKFNKTLQQQKIRIKITTWRFKIFHSWKKYPGYLVYF